jgi:hypothetical protein
VRHRRRPWDDVMIDPFDNMAQSAEHLTDYDRAHIKLYMRLLDAAADGADWREAVEILFGIDPVREPERARHVHDSHLARARWMTHTGYKHLLREPRV